MTRAIAILVLVVAAGVARAQPPAGELPENPEAAAHLDRGQELYKKRDFADAIDEFRAGYALEPKRVFLYALAQAEREAGDCPSAVEHYRQFLATDPPASMKTFAEQGLAACPATEAPPPPPPRPPPPPPPPPELPTAPAWYRDPIAGALTGVGVVALGIGVGYGFAARSSSNAAAEALSLDRYDELSERARSRTAVALVGIAVGSALIAGGVTRYVLARRASKSAVTVGWMPGGLTIAGAF